MGVLSNAEYLVVWSGFAGQRSSDDGSNNTSFHLHTSEPWTKKGLTRVVFLRVVICSLLILRDPNRKLVSVLAISWWVLEQ